MDLGKFSLSLAVNDIEKSLAFYSVLGFEVLDGGHVSAGFPDSDQMKWRILKHDAVVIGLFQGMFENNILTFNPSDVRSIQAKLKQSSIALLQEADESTSGPGMIMLQDPDGNMLMFDQP